jgi:hypothetical protein
MAATTRGLSSVSSGEDEHQAYRSEHPVKAELFQALEFIEQRLYAARRSK